MMIHAFIPHRALIAGCFALALAGQALAQEVRTETLASTTLSPGSVLEGKIKGDDSVRYIVTGEAGQILSVDLSSTKGRLNFNITPSGADTALFTSTTSGTVADVILPAAGEYVVEVFLMRNAARRDEAADFQIGIALNGADFADSLAGGPDWWQVTGLAEGVMLDLRAGPALRFDGTGQVGQGEAAQNLGCRLTLGERWCSIRVAGSGGQGWVPGANLMEGAAPMMAEMPEGGPVGNGIPWDATGALPCATAEGQPMRDCLFGVVRDGPGNAGVWIAIGDAQERQFLFEGGQPVSTNIDAELSVTKTGDLFTITVQQERYEIPEAVVNGG